MDICSRLPESWLHNRGKPKRTTREPSCERFPEPSESYVGEEIEALRAHHVDVTAYSVQRPARPDASALYLVPLRLSYCAVASCLLLRRFSRIRDLILRVLC